MATLSAMSLQALLAGHPVPVVSDPRQTSTTVHRHLRRLIMTGVLPPGTVLNQAELSKLLAVSRTPTREAFRMLQEEGLVEADLNQRPRVKGFDPEELDTLYAARISLECLGVHATAGRLSTAERKEAGQLLRAMKHAAGLDDLDRWSVLHDRFHEILVVRVGAFVSRTIASYAAQSERYRRLYGAEHPGAVGERHEEHAALLDAVVAGERDRATELMAMHLAATARLVLADFDAAFEPRSIACAVDLMSRCDPR